MTKIYRIKTHDKTKSRARNLKYQGVTIYQEQNNFARDGEYSNGHETVHFTHGLLNNSVDSDGFAKPAYQNDKGDAEYFENGLLNREAAPAVIRDWGVWEEWWHHGELVLIQTTRKVTAEIVGRVK